MSERRRALGRGLGALIPSAPPGGSGNRPVDVFFPEQNRQSAEVEEEAGPPSGQKSQVGADRAVTGDGSRVQESRNETNGGLGAPVATALRPAPHLTDQDEAATSTRKDAQHGDGPDSANPGDPAEAADDGLADDGLVEVPGARFAEVPIASIEPNPRQPRQVFDEDDLDELAASIREVGVLQPVVVRPHGTGSDGRARYELIMGERRWRASQAAGAESVPAIIRDTGAQDMLRDALLENLHRAQLNPLEEAAAYQQLLDDFDCTHEELATRIARSRPQISNTLRLLKLPPLVQRRLAAGVLSAGHARALLGLPDGAAMERMAQRIVAEGLSVRATEELITLGEDPAQPEMRRRPRAGAHSAALNDLGSRLSDKFDTKVKVALGQRKGRINIEFASVQDLNRILKVLAPNDPGLFTGEQEPTHDG